MLVYCMWSSVFCFIHLILHIGRLSPPVCVALHRYVKLPYSISYYGYLQYSFPIEGYLGSSGVLL